MIHCLSLLSSLQRRYARVIVLCAGLFITPFAFAAVSIQQASNDTSNVYYQVGYTSRPTFFRLYLDTDQNAGSGFKLGGIGANYLVENDRLYRYSGFNNSWKWRYIKTISTTNSEGLANWTIARADIGSPTAINLIAQTSPPLENSTKVTQNLS